MVVDETGFDLFGFFGVPFISMVAKEMPAGNVMRDNLFLSLPK